METKKQEIRTSPKQLNAFYAIKMRASRKAIQEQVYAFSLLPIAEATIILTQMMKDNPAPPKKMPIAAPTQPTTQVVAPTGVN